MQTADEIAEVEAFLDAVKGRLDGFWLPTPLEALRITAFVGVTASTTEFDIVDQNLRDSFADHPGQYLYLTQEDGTAIAAKITAVTDNGDGTERVTDTGFFNADHYAAGADDPPDENIFEVQALDYLILNATEGTLKRHAGGYDWQTVVGTASGKIGFYGVTPVTRPASADQAAVTLGNTDGEIAALTISDPPTQAEVQALRNKAEELADDVRNLSTLIHALRTALLAEGLIKGGA